jgi:hypothetical protein
MSLKAIYGQAISSTLAEIAVYFEWLRNARTWSSYIAKRQQKSAAAINLSSLGRHILEWPDLTP